MYSYNQPIVELKYVDNDDFPDMLAPYNQPIVELKYPYPEMTTSEISLTISP